MWLLESDGDVFHGQQLWLRPGKRFIFGRTLRDAGGFVIENKTISRKHLVIEVGAVEPGDAIILKKRSTVTLEDQKTKIGTLVNGEQIRGLRHTLAGDVHEIILGHYEHSFRITWKPVVISFSFSKEFKAGNPVDLMCQQLNGLDIKVMLDVVRGSTTHVVAKKRNTPKVLEALISGCFIVEIPFLDAIIKAAEQPEDGMSSLETDFRASWPNPENYLPPRGKEPTTRPNKDYYPNLGRRDVFDGYTFVFYEQAQFDNLLAPITSGRGKALLRQAEPSVTTVEEFAGYVKSVAGEKSLGEFEDGSEGKGVVVVKYQPAEGPTLSWYSDFGTKVSLHLDHRLILQNEFLDAILNNDASELRRPLEIEQSGTIGPSWMTGAPEAVFARTTTGDPSTIPSSSAVEEVLGSSAPATVLAIKLGRSRRAVTSRFKGFGGEFDMLSIPESSQMVPALAPVSQSQNSGMFVSQDMEVDHQISSEIANQSRLSRKRPSPPPIEIEDEDDFLDQLAPSAANLKRRRLAEDVVRRRRGDSTLPSSVIPPKQQTPVQKAKKPKEQIDVLEVARIQREKEEETARLERESLQEAMGDMDIDQIRKLAVIEEFEVRRSAPPLRAIGHADDSDRWDERWNGRKNFKKFRRRGDIGVRAVNKVIIPLQEVKKKDFGIGDDYWLEGDKSAQQTRKKGKGRAKDTHSVNQFETQPIPARNTRGWAVEVAEGSDVEHLEALPIDTHPATQTSSTAAKSQTLTDKTKTSVNKHKRAAEPITKPAPAKKPRPASRRAAIADSDDSDDGLGFRFRKKT